MKQRGHCLPRRLLGSCGLERVTWKARPSLRGTEGSTGSSRLGAWVRGLRVATSSVVTRFHAPELPLPPRPHLLFQEAPVLKKLPVVR